MANGSVDGADVGYDEYAWVGWEDGRATADGSTDGAVDITAGATLGTSGVTVAGAAEG